MFLSVKGEQARYTWLVPPERLIATAALDPVSTGPLRLSHSRTPAELRPRRRVGLEHANLGEATKLIVERHYLRRGRTMAQLPYWITLDGIRCGVILYSLPRLSVASQKFRGHSPMQMIELARMWIDPEVQGKYVLDHTGSSHSLPIASAAIAKSMRVVRQDWHGKYPHLPEILACIAWADQTRHAGTIYRASNFEFVGHSGGSMHRNRARSNGGQDQLRSDYLNTKAAYMFEFPSALTRRQRDQGIDDWVSRRPRRRIRSTAASRLSAVLDTV